MSDMSPQPAQADPNQPPGPMPPPDLPPQGPVPAPLPPAAMQEAAMEIELRDHLGAALAKTALSMTQQVAFLSAGDPDAGHCKDMAQAVLYMTEALVLVAPIESTGATAGPGGAPVPLPPKHMPPQVGLHTAEQQATGRAA